LGRPILLADSLVGRALLPARNIRGQECPRQCAREGALSEGWKSPPGHTLSGPETERNCVAAMRGGEQREVNRWSVGRRTRFGSVSGRACWRKAKPESGESR
jgi:hypothetical protein